MRTAWLFLIVVAALVPGCQERDPDKGQASGSMPKEQGAPPKRSVADYLDEIIQETEDVDRRELAIRIAMLKSRDPDIRKKACSSVALLNGAAQAAPHLVEILFKDSEEYVRLDAAKALFSIRPPELPTILAECARHARMHSPYQQLEVRSYCAGLLAQVERALPDDLYETLRLGVLKPEINFAQANAGAVEGLLALDGRPGREALLLQALERAESQLNAEAVARALATLVGFELPKHPRKDDIEKLKAAAEAALDQKTK